MTTEANKDLLIEFGLRIINAMDYTGKTVDSVLNAPKVWLLEYAAHLIKSN